MVNARCRIKGVVILILFIVILLTGCSSENIRSPKPRSDWSCGIRVGFAHGLTQPSLIVEDDGTVNIAWTVETALNSGKIGYSKISPNGEFLIQSTTSIPEVIFVGAHYERAAKG